MASCPFVKGANKKRKSNDDGESCPFVKKSARNGASKGSNKTSDSDKAKQKKNGSDSGGKQKRSSTGSHGKQKKRHSNGTAGPEGEEVDPYARLQEIEDERQQKWKDKWDKKLAEEERLDKCQACCKPCEHFPKPTIQRNLWLQVNHEKNAQHVYMTFQDVPAPKPPVPLLPKLRLADLEPLPPCENPKAKKKKGKKK